jgi:glutamine synthetase
VVWNVANAYGKTATFMPKPYAGDNGSGMHVHQSVWKDGKNLFAGDGYAGLSEFRAVLHRRHHQARACAQRHHQPRHQQLQAPGPRHFEAPVKLAYSAAQPLGLDPHPVCAEPQGSSYRSALPRSF